MPKVKPSQAESYLCTPIRLDTEATYYVTGFKPNATKMTAHHMLIYGCEEPGMNQIQLLDINRMKSIDITQKKHMVNLDQTSDRHNHNICMQTISIIVLHPIIMLFIPGADVATWNCGEMAAAIEPDMEQHPVCGPGSQSQIIYAWAMDAPGLQLPEGVGFRVGGDTNIKYLVLQVHYASTDYIDADGDDSGVILQYTEQQQPKTAGVLLLGTGGSAPAHSTTFFETSCDIEDPRTIHPFAFRTHTHSLGIF